jgi:serine/threonine-protein kinase
MSHSPDRQDHGQPISLLRHIERVCSRFEEAWKMGTRPRIEDYVGDTPEPGRSTLLRELIDLEIAYRQRAGEQPQSEEYRQRFRDLELMELEHDRARSPDLDADRLAELLTEGADRNAKAPATIDCPLRETDVSPGEPSRQVRSLGDYELLEEIAHGGMGVVHKARQLSLNRLVALKMIRAGEFASPAEVQRFRQEAESAANLDHPHIVPIFEVNEHAGYHYYAMKLIEGGSLAQSHDSWNLKPELDRRETRRRQEKIVKLMITVARAIQHAHERAFFTAI